MCLYSLSVYETSTHFYIIGSNATKTKFSTLKIDRTLEKDFVVGESDHNYSQADINELLATISSSSIVTPSENWNKKQIIKNGLLRTVDNAYGIIGAIKFLEGYYLLIITKAKIVVKIGYHSIYKIEDVSMIYIPASGVPVHPDEQKYSKLFRSVDLTTNFYFSYSYDISRTLQENVLAQKGLSWNKNNYFKKMLSEDKFVWNTFLLKPFKNNFISNRWTLEIVHGYVGYNIVEIPCAKILIALIARRSAVFAGTRFLKRGTNFNGAVANDVEIEQIVWDISSTPNFFTGKFASYVQRRGSVPLFWSQDPSTRGVVGKPPIYVNLNEPNAFTTAAHFKELRRKYGYPIIVINLVKRGKQRHNENILHEQFLKTVKYLNEFTKDGKRIDYIGFDVSRCNKSGQVLQKLEQLGARTVIVNGWFQSFPELKCRKLRRHWLLEYFKPMYLDNNSIMVQHGIARANCVDCLDRTNVAQFGIGKVALGFQLYSMGYIEEPLISLNTELNRILEELYDEHGDTLAWQYAGSQLVHSIKTYKKTSVLQERSRDIVQTISRYYSNTFSDYEKQDGINLFLGIFRPLIDLRLTNDRYLHFPPTFKRKNEYLMWAISVSSDSNSSDEEKETKLQLKKKSLLSIDYVDNRQLKKETAINSLFQDNLNLDNKKNSFFIEKQKFNENLLYKELFETSLEDWIKLKCKEIELDSNFYTLGFDTVNQSNNNKKKILTEEFNDSLEFFFSKNLKNYAMNYCIFELTNFDQLLKETSLAKRITLIDTLNPHQFNVIPFINFFKCENSTNQLNSFTQKKFLSDLKTINAHNTTSYTLNNEINSCYKVEEIVPISQTVEFEEEFLNVDEDRNSNLFPAKIIFQKVQFYQQFQTINATQQFQNQQSRSLSPLALNSTPFFYQGQHHYNTSQQQKNLNVSLMPSISINFLQLRQESIKNKCSEPNTFSYCNNKIFHNVIAKKPKITLECGLKSTKKIYGFQEKKISNSDYEKYERYASISIQTYKNFYHFKENAENNKNLFISLNSPIKDILFQKKIMPYFKFNTPFFTVDNAFHTEINEVSVESFNAYCKHANQLAVTKNIKYV